jgi:hypothetical protein
MATSGFPLRSDASPAPAACSLIRLASLPTLSPAGFFYRYTSSKIFLQIKYSWNITVILRWPNILKNFQKINTWTKIIA